MLFTDALREWQYHAFELDRLRGIDSMQCPACSYGMHACHVDGNRKVYRYGYNKRCIFQLFNFHLISSFFVFDFLRFQYVYYIPISIY